MTKQEEIQEKVAKQLSPIPEEHYGYYKVTLYNVIRLAMDLAFNRGVDFVFYGNPMTTGDHTDYKALSEFLHTNDCFCELTDDDIEFFMDELRKAKL